MRRASHTILTAVLLASVFLPWFSVSCSGQPIVAGTGAELALGSVDLTTVDAVAASDPGLVAAAERAATALLWGHLWIVAILALGVIGLAVALVRRRGAATWLTRVLALQGLLLAVVLPAAPAALARLLATGLGAEVFGRPVDSPAVQTILADIRIDAGSGYWMAAAATLVGLLLSVLRRRAAVPGAETATATATAATTARGDRAGPATRAQGDAVPAAPAQREAHPAAVTLTRAPSPSAPSAVPGLFTAPARISLAYHDGNDWRQVHQAVLSADPLDLGRLRPELAGIVVQCLAGRVTIDAHWSAPVTLHRGAAATPIDPAPPRLVAWPGDVLVAGGWSFAFTDGA